MDLREYDVLIIGAGVSGSAIARELARRERRIAVLERESDVCEGTSKANSGIVHAGYDALPGSLKARLNVQGNRMMKALSEELDFPFWQNGSLVVGFGEESLEKLRELYERGRKNGVENLRILDGGEARRLEPALSRDVYAALYAPTGGIVCPFGLNIAMAENAAENGVDFYLHTEVRKIARAEEGYLVTAGGRTFRAPVVVNAAGVYADVIHNMVSESRMKITPRRGEYCLMDKEAGAMLKHTVFQLPTEKGKGTLVTPTVHGNLLAGPNAEDIADKEGTDTTLAGISQVLGTAARSMEEFPHSQVITSFAGLRAVEESGDFVIGEAADAPGFFDAAGIASPGLTSAPAIGVYVAGLIQERFPAPEREHFKPVRKGIPNMAQAGGEERRRLIASDPAYANVVCRCELVTEGEILSAIHRPLGATTLDGVKRRTRAGMGRCQAGFCSPKVVEILARELHADLGDITKSGGESVVLTGCNKERD